MYSVKCIVSSAQSIVYVLCIHTKEMHIFLSLVFLFSLNGSTCFGLSLVHHQEQHLISCRSGCSQTYRYVPIALYSLLNVVPDDGLMIVRNMNNHLTKKIKAIHKNLCIFLVYIRIAIRCTVHTASKFMVCSAQCVLYGV